MMRKQIAGFLVRLVIATLISLTGWYLFTTPFDRLPVSRMAAAVVARILDFPVAVAGELLPIRGMELVFENHDTWCDFCSYADLFNMQMRLAIPIYVLLLYVPLPLRALARRHPRLLARIVVGLLSYTTIAAGFSLLVGGDDPRTDVRIAEMGLMVLAPAAAFAWSERSRRARAVGIGAALVVGSWAVFLLMARIAPTTAELRLDFVSILLLLGLVTGGTLALTGAWETSGLGTKRAARTESQTD